MDVLTCSVDLPIVNMSPVVVMVRPEPPLIYYSPKDSKPIFYGCIKLLTYPIVVCAWKTCKKNLNHDLDKLCLVSAIV